MKIRVLTMRPRINTSEWLDVNGDKGILEGI